MESITSITFEILPLERLDIIDTVKAFTDFSLALEKIGYLVKEEETNFLLFKVHDKDRLSKAAFSELGYYEEYYWFAANYCRFLLITIREGNILFALASDGDPDEEGPCNTLARSISTQIIGPISSPSIARMLVFRALWENEHREFAEQINVSSSLNETVMTGSISFVEQPSGYMAGASITSEWEYQFHPLSVLDVRRLQPQNIMPLLIKEFDIDEVQIAKVLPIPLSKDINYFAVGAKFGTLKPVLREMMEIALHLNWSLPLYKDKLLDREKAFKVALSQRSRFRDLERVEEHLQYSLDLLQKRYPDKIEILEWKINNIYTNTIRYSPVYLSLQADIEAFLTRGDNWQVWLGNRLAELDWQPLILNKAATSEDAEKLIKLSELDPSSALTKMRVIVEKIIQVIYRQSYPNQSFPVLADMLRQLNTQNTFPPIIYVCLNTIRQAGNIGAHGNQAQNDDIMAIIPLFIRVVEWFVDHEKQSY